MIVKFLLHPLLIRLSRIVSILLLLVLLGLLARPIEAPAWKAVKAGQSEMNLEAFEGALGQGLIIGVLGGFRAILADFLWIRTNIIWERKDRAKLDSMVRLVTTLDPRPDFFWINGSRMIEIKAQGGRLARVERPRLSLDAYFLKEVHQREIEHVTQQEGGEEL